MRISRLRASSSYLLPSKSQTVSYARFACDDLVCVFEELIQYITPVLEDQLFEWKNSRYILSFVSENSRLVFSRWQVSPALVLCLLKDFPDRVPFSNRSNCFRRADTGTSSTLNTGLKTGWFCRFHPHTDHYIRRRMQQLADNLVSLEIRPKSFLQLPHFNLLFLMTE